MRDATESISEELVIRSTAQFRFLRLRSLFHRLNHAAKENPDAAELIRAKIGRIWGQTALMIVMKGLALTYSKDMQEDKEPVFDAADNLLALAAMTGMVNDMTAVPKRLRRRRVRGLPQQLTLLIGWCAKRDWLGRTSRHWGLVALAETKDCALHELTLSDMQRK